MNFIATINTFFIAHGDILFGLTLALMVQLSFVLTPFKRETPQNKEVVAESVVERAEDEDPVVTYYYTHYPMFNF